MSKLEHQQGVPTGLGDEGPLLTPRGDEGLDDWFERRLQAQGIKRPRPRIPVARVLSVLALAASLGALAWAIDSAGGDDTETAAPTQPRRNAGGGGGNAAAGKGDKDAGARPLRWNRVRVDVLNGYGGANAAGEAASDLRAAGWRIGRTADAGTETTQTTVVFAPGRARAARVVARRLGLGSPQPAAGLPGVPAGAVRGVAILLGPDGIAATA